MKIIMLESRKGTEDSFAVNQYLCGKKYNVTNSLANTFFIAGYAIPEKLKENFMNTPYLTLSVKPSEEPITLTEAKLYLRIDDTSEDTLITRLISSARESAEKYMKRSLITQTWKLTYDDYSPAVIFLPKGPVISISSVKLIARDTTETVISGSKYYLNSGKEKLVLDSAMIGHIVEVTYVTGFGDASSVPNSIKQGILIHIAELYENRTAPLEQTSRTLFDQHRVIRL